jgi:hypothetical protein
VKEGYAVMLGPGTYRLAAWSASKSITNSRSVALR